MYQSAEVAPDAFVSSRYFLSQIGQMYSSFGFDSMPAFRRRMLLIDPAEW